MLNKEVFLEMVYQMTSSLDRILAEEELEKLESVVLGMGFKSEELKSMDEFITKNITKKEHDEMMLTKSFVKYVEALGDMKEFISQMEKGYEEMGDINLEIANKDAQIIDNEGYDISEVDGKNAKTGS